MNNKSIIVEKPLRIGLLLFLGMLVIFIAFNAALVLPYMLAILMGLMLKVFANTPYCFLRRKGMGPKLSASIIVVGILLIMVGPLAMFLTIAVGQAIDLGHWLSNKDIFSINLLIHKIGKIGPMDDLFGGAKAFEKQIRMGIQE